MFLLCFPCLVAKNGTLFPVQSSSPFIVFFSSSWLFEHLGYKVIIEKNQDAEAFEQVIQNFAANPEHQFGDSAIVIVLSHGQEHGVYCCDGLVVKFKTLMDMLDGELCPLLIRKPKLFFIQACRGRVRQVIRFLFRRFMSF